MPLSIRCVPLLALLSACVLSGLGGCRAPEPLPRHEWQDVQHALNVIEQRQQQIRTLSAECRLTLRRANGDAVTLNGLMVAQRPDHLRAQAWKFDQKVLDLTIRPDGVWVWVSERVQENETDADDQTDAASPMINTPGTHWLEAIFSLPEADDAQVIDAGDDDDPMVLRWHRGEDEDAGHVQLAIDRPTLTVRAFDVLDGDGETTQHITLARYRLIDGIAMPTHLAAESGTRSIELRLHALTLNEALPAAVFEPPADAERRD